MSEQELEKVFLYTQREYKDSEQDFRSYKGANELIDSLDDSFSEEEAHESIDEFYKSLKSRNRKKRILLYNI